MSTNNIDKMAKQFKNMVELQQYCDIQYQTIISLTQKVNDFNAKNKHLEELLANSTPIIKDQASEIQLIANCTDEETICRIQLKKLRDKSISGDELTLEETKRVEIYTKLLIAIKSGDVKVKEETTKQFDDASLLSLVMDDSK